MNSILYISTNLIWSGSEELWSGSAIRLIDKGYSIAFASRYDHPELNKINAPHINYTPRVDRLKSLIRRGIRRLTGFNLSSKNLLKEFIQQQDPQLIIISQGDTFQALEVIQYCRELGIPYVIITQLVGDIFISGFASHKLSDILQAYTAAKKNYFVSLHNLQLHNTMLGVDLANAEVVYNPCKISGIEIPAFPEPNGIYNIGLVGRIDCWHKGYDLLVQVASKEKWRNRAVRFNIYGNGPYAEYMKEIVTIKKLSNIAFKGHINNISEVWSRNQILCMPSRMEGQALALIEAMYSQRAAVVTNVGGASELIEDGYSGFIADLPTVESVDAALDRAWEQRSNWKEMGLNAATALKTKYPADAIAFFNNKILELLK